MERPPYALPTESTGVVAGLGNDFPPRRPDDHMCQDDHMFPFDDRHREDQQKWSKRSEVISDDVLLRQPEDLFLGQPFMIALSVSSIDRLQPNLEKLGP